MRLADTRLLWVTGKGGVGKTTTAIALAFAAASHGKKVAIVEFYGAGSVPAAWGLSQRTYAAQSLAPRVDTLSLTPRDCLNEFGKRSLKINALAKFFLGNRVVSAFLDAVPGLHDLVQLGKVLHMLDEPDSDEVAYDLLILDAPATGHGLTLLDTAAAMQEMTRVGPLYDLSAQIDRLLRDPLRSGGVLVATPEELPARETQDLLEQLGPRRAMVKALILNQVQAPPLATIPWDLAEASLREIAPSLAAFGARLHAETRQQAVWRDMLAQVAGNTRLFELPRVAALDPGAITGFSAQIADFWELP